MSVMQLWYRKRTQSLCQNKFKRPSRLDKNCHCQYLHHKNPYLLLGPFKYERLNKVPEIGYFHELLYDTESNEITKEALPTLKATSYTGYKTTKNAENLEYSPQRTSKTTYLNERDEKSISSKISKRVELATRCKMYEQYTAEELLQVKKTTKFSILINFYLYHCTGCLIQIYQFIVQYCVP